MNSHTHLYMLYGCVYILALSLDTNMKSLSDSSLSPVFIEALTFRPMHKNIV